MNGSYLEHLVVRSAVWSTVSHWLHGHRWAYPVVVVLVLFMVVRGRIRRRRYRKVRVR